MSTRAVAEVSAVKRTAGYVLLRPFLAWGFAALVTLLSIGALRPPDPLPASAPPDAFSAERALVHVHTIALKPHPIGSNESASVREYLVAQLSALGLDSRIFQGTGTLNRSGRINFGDVKDIVARLPGTANTRAIMLMAHYDSVYRAPGAADDAASVAAILESLRALRTGPALKNDVIVLFTDGEEAGLLGAEAFASSHPWMQDIGLIMNFEARGNKGPSLLFETGANDHALIQAVAKAAPEPIGSSLFYALYRLLPNQTDYTVFRARNIPGLNFAFGEGLDAYHTQLDTPAHLSAGSVQHQGSYILSLTRQFGQMDLRDLNAARGDDIFFDWLGGKLIRYREIWVIPGQVLVTALLVSVIILNVRRGRVRGASVAAALPFAILFIVAVPGTSAAAQWLLFRALASRRIVADSAANSLLLTGIALLGVVTGSVLFAWVRKRYTVQELSVTGLAIVCVLSWIVALELPAGSYLLFWPLLVMTIGLLVTALKASPAPQALSIAGVAGMTASLLLFAPIAYLLYVFLTLQLLTVLAVGLLISILFLLCFPFMDMAVPGEGWRPAVATIFSLAIVSFAAGGAFSRYSPEHPRRDSILYSFNADGQNSRWVSYDQVADGWTSQYLSNNTPTRGVMPDYLGGFSRPVLSAPAPRFTLAPPSAQVQADQMDGTVRKVDLSVQSTRDAALIVLTFPVDAHLTSVKIKGRAATPLTSGGLQSISLLGMGTEPTIVQLTFNSGSRVSFWLMDQAYGLPGPAVPRPADLMAAEGSDVTLVCRKYSL
jgi:peptidase M28-like protein